MATVIPTKFPTLADVATRVDSSGNTVEIVEVLKQTNEMLDDIPFVACNNGTQHKTTVRSGLPSVTWRKLNWGVQPSKSQTTTIQDSCGMLAAFAKVDKKLVELNKNSEAWRQSEEAPFLEAMGQEAQRAFLFGDSSVDPEKIMGLAPRFNTTSKEKAECAENVIDAGGTGSKLTSIWLVGWGLNTVHGLYPEGSKAGLTRRDIGEEAALDEQGGEYRVLKTEYGWDLGLCVRDWRYVVRIANIDVTKLKAKPTDKDVNLIDLMVDAIEKIPNPSGVRLAFYCNRTISAMLRKQIRYADNVNLSMSEVAGKPVVTFDGVPIRRVDALTATETKVQ